MPKTQRFDSRFIHSVSYNENFRRLTVRLKGKDGKISGTYRYFGVTPTQYESLNSAPSAGGYYLQHIKPNYACEKLASGKWVPAKK